VAEAVAVVAETQPKDGGAQGPGSLEEKVDKMCESLLGKLPLTFKGKFLSCNMLPREYFSIDCA